ncbi:MULTISPECIES: CmpA/NrtA family ABC transporter substrate-binding protein [unclassified Pseudomonas]|uniref:CmpA/NrtA family ABC transporter substrate-binding protein n=1 Tax=unclassified Pseudomonas TaxID=196821 RepID=UPI0008D7BA52|nr:MULTISPECIES: CmpA/NrtA family ABC transporter substrate-binding protein [unclassified Pseudomonas]PMV21671.1 nitrate ABC transporter substrate-binding protein [Pseudomonas sp. FW305-3-2-15-C-TSA2]PMV28440.1 nitrate ABC transporter substrate-binding protein [Pseudomonas sp. DP16D-L5]PMV38838.1 nitrate ABC transporter substrate-binding protein [Pseudomonas sp. FW305-3-2-15-A-LB2]PMV40060.1 nitrate ABC transporter substrate-binding protein [Pseudomonas sp. FW305-3-2-15-C-R2A1]PMV50971.1 nitra
MNDSVGNSPMNDPRAWVNGSDAPEKSSLDLGFMALSDCASVVVAATQGFAQPYGLTLNLKRQSSWANLRDKLVSGELDAAHSLYGLIYAVHLGIGGVAPTDMAVLMGLNQNGQSINLSHGLQRQGVITPEALDRHVHQSRTKLTFAQTFPTGTHAMWLYYWLASQGIHPLQDVDSVVVPPPQMVAHLQAGRIDGFCVGEPWCASAVKQNQGFTLATSQAIWPDHPEKVLGCTRTFVDQYPNTARVLVMAILEASRFIEESTENRRSTAQLLSGREYLDAPLDCIEPRLLGAYDDGLGNQWQDPHALRFFAGGEVNLPYLSDGMWFMTQFRRWGLLREDPDYLGVARQVQQLALYRQAAGALGIPVKAQDMRSSQLIDGKIWDGSNPTEYARSFRLHALANDSNRQAWR